jgi:pyroglutamyl-peptidase
MDRSDQMKQLLLTGFEPFQDFAVNPSAVVVKALAGQVIGGYRVSAQILPVAFEEAGALIIRRITELAPDAVLCLGLAAGRSKLTVERVAINCREGTAGCGRNYSGELIEPAGETAYFSTLPVREIVDYICGHGLPAAVSNTAGTFVCNDVMYRVLYHLSSTTAGAVLPAGFIHLPASHTMALDQAAYPSWSDTDLVQGVSLAVEAMGNYGHPPGPGSG